MTFFPIYLHQTGIPNPLFAADNTLLLFGDGKEAILGRITALKEF